jgi:hypothetical protein
MESSSVDGISHFRAAMMVHPPAVWPTPHGAKQQAVQVLLLFELGSAGNDNRAHLAALVHCHQINVDVTVAI